MNLKKRSFWGLIRMKNGRFLVGQKLSEISEKLGEGGSQLERFFRFFDGIPYPRYRFIFLTFDFYYLSLKQMEDR